MKRFVNNVPLGSITALIPGFTKVTIEDRQASQVYNDNAESTERWTGLVMDIYKAEDKVKYKWTISRVHELRHTDDGLLFIISTQYEEY